MSNLKEMEIEKTEPAREIAMEKIETLEITRKRLEKLDIKIRKVENLEKLKNLEKLEIARDIARDKLELEIMIELRTKETISPFEIRSPCSYLNDRTMNNIFSDTRITKKLPIIPEETTLSGFKICFSINKIIDKTEIT